MGVTGGIRPTPRNVTLMSDQIPGGPEGPNQWQVIGISRDQWKLLAASLVLGGNVRAGVEDNLYLPNGEMCKSNGDLIAKARQMAEDIGRRAATVAEARELLGVPQAGGGLSRWRSRSTAPASPGTAARGRTSAPTRSCSAPSRCPAPRRSSSAATSPSRTPRRCWSPRSPAATCSGSWGWQGKRASRSPPTKTTPKPSSTASASPRRPCGRPSAGRASRPTPTRSRSSTAAPTSSASSPTRSSSRSEVEPP